MTVALVNWDELLRQKHELPSVPSIAALVLETVELAELALEDLETLVLHDPALTTQVLRLANSSLFGPPGRFSTMRHALARMDIHAARLVALSFHLEPACRDSSRYDYSQCWRRSWATSAAAARIARFFPEVNFDQVRVAGLLTGVGRLFLAEAIGAQYAEIRKEAEGTDQDLAAVERSHLGADSAEVAGMLLTHWQFPAEIVDSVRSHQRPETIESLPEHPRELAKTLYIGSLMVEGICFGAREKLQSAKAFCERWAKIDPQTYESLIAGVRRELRDREGLYLPSDHDCDDLLNRARKRLREFSLETAMKLANKTRQAEQSQQQLEALKKEADRLAEQATTDALTGVGNRKFFDTRLSEEVNRSKRNHTPLSLIFFDLDRFKRLNDTHGHQAGDLVLKMTAGAIKKIMRTSDVLARYGGEELALIAPGADPAGALATAERTRQTVESLSVLYNDRCLKTTASFGVVTVVDPQNLESEDQLVALADECLYEAKRAGRNCIRSTTV